ncbi:MAG: protease HtpX [Epsilonproteobacteria bacterium]|nr:protease HtpX [Campylobacterota bacterium]
MAIVMLIVMNLAVMASLYVVLFILSAFFGIHLDNSVNSLLLIAFVFGFGGAFISLLLSKTMAKSGMGVRVIQTPQNQTEEWLLMTISKLSAKAGIKMPEVGIFDGPPNAFATGWNKNDALVAVSTSLLDIMQPKEVEGVLAHEISHIKHGDMVTMTLMQGVLNTFVIFISRIIASILTSNDEEEEGEGMSYFIVSFVLEMIFSLFATAILMWFSRYREFKADEGAVRLDGKEGIYYALAKLGEIPKEQLALPSEMKAFGIVGFLESIFASHPPIHERLEHIKNLKI